MIQITHVAIQYAGKTYALPAPNRHHHVIRLIAQENGVGIKGPDVQGFLTSDGAFLGRIGALQLAKDNGQLNRRTQPGDYQGDELYSENIW